MNIFSYGQSMVNLYRAVAPVSKPSPLQTANIDGVASFVRIAQFPWVPNVKLTLEPHAINFYHPYQIANIDLTAPFRYMNDEGRKNFVILARMTCIMLKLLPPIPSGSDKYVHPITKIYQHALVGLQHIIKTFFIKSDPYDKEIDMRTINSFDFDYASITGEITVKKAGNIVQKTIKILQYALINKIEPKPNEQLSAIEIAVKNIYKSNFIEQIARGLDLMVEVQGKTSLESEWLCVHEFESVNCIILGRLSIYEKSLDKISKMPGNKNNQSPFILIEQKINKEIKDTENKDLEKEIIDINFDPEKNLTYDEILNDEVNYDINFTNQLKSHEDYTENLGGEQWVEDVDYNIPNAENRATASFTNTTTTTAKKRNSNENVLIY